jgi:ribosomal protein L12E/L44/L45/RPP1/RPP2
MEINADKMQKLIKSSGNTVDGFWCKLFSTALGGQNVESLLMNSGSGNAGPQVQAAADNN